MNPIEVKIETKASKEKVWSAITELHQMKEWYFDNIPNFEPIVNFETSFNVSSKDRDFYHQWKVSEVVINEKISYFWTFKNIKGKSVSIFEISEKGDKREIKINSIVLENFPEDIPEFKRESGVEGWKYFANKLKLYLEE